MKVGTAHFDQGIVDSSRKYTRFVRAGMSVTTRVQNPHAILWRGQPRSAREQQGDE